MLNRIKKHAMALAALTIAIGSVTLMSFKSEKSSLADEKWFEFTDETGDGNQNNPENYILTPSSGANPPSCPTGNDETCAVKAPSQMINGEEHPDLTNVVEEIERKLQ